MHELSVTQNIIDACSERANGAQVLRVTLEIGVLSCVMPGSLRFCYDVASKDTPLEGSELEIILPRRAAAVTAARTWKCRICFLPARSVRTISNNHKAATD